RVNRPFHAVTAAQGRVAASSYEYPSGTFTSPSSERHTYSDSMPSSCPPRADEGACASGRPLSQRWKKAAATRSPLLKRVTPSPSEATSPAPSDKGTSASRGG